jgi:hypothetical protein
MVLKETLIFQIIGPESPRHTKQENIVWVLENLIHGFSLDDRLMHGFGISDLLINGFRLGDPLIRSFGLDDL